MKKILFLAFALVLAVGMTAAAADISFSGEVGTEAQWEAGDDFGEQETIGGTLEFNVNAQVDEWNSLYFETEWAQAGAFNVLDIGEFALESDLGGWIGDEFGAPLPFGMVYKTGFAEWSYENIAEVSAYEFEGLGVSEFTEIGQQFTFNFAEMVNVYLAHGFDAGAEDLANILFGLDTMIPLEGVGELGLEFVYFQDGDKEDGELGFGTSFAMDIMPDLAGSLGASYTMDLDDDAGDGNEWGLGVGAAVDYMDGLVGASVSFAGDDDEIFDRVGLGLNTTPVEFLTFEAGLVLANDDRYAETMNSADLAMILKAGAAEFTLGYLWMNDDLTSTDADGNLAALSSLNAVSENFPGPYFAVSLEY